MVFGIPLSRNVTRVTVTEAPLSLTMLSSTALKVPLTVPVLIAPRIKNLLPHPHKAARRAKPSVSDRRRFTTPPPFREKYSYRKFTPNHLSSRPEPDPERTERELRSGEPGLSEAEGNRASARRVSKRRIYSRRTDSRLPCAIYC